MEGLNLPIPDLPPLQREGASTPLYENGKSENGAWSDEYLCDSDVSEDSVDIDFNLGMNSTKWWTIFQKLLSPT